MPKCIFNCCPHSTGLKAKYPDVTLHTFPKNLQMIKLWIASSALSEEDLTSVAEEILRDKNGNRFRMCSAHFSTDSYCNKKKTRVLKSDAVPSVLPNDISMSFMKIKKTHICCPCHQFCVKNDTREMGTQTGEDLNISVSEKSYAFWANYRDIGHDHEYSLSCPIVDPQLKSTPAKLQNVEDIPVFQITPIKSAVTLPYGDFAEAGSSTSHLILSSEHNVIHIEHDAKENMDTISQSDTSTDHNMTQDDSYVPDLFEQSETDISRADSSFIIDDTVAAKEHCLGVDERKFIVFESNLDQLLSKLRCPKEECFEKITSFNKIMVGTLLKVYSTCMENHQLLIWESQTKIGNLAAGNLIFASAMTCSGSSFTSVKQMMDFCNIPFFSKATYHTYLNKFIYGGIDYCWLEEKDKIKQKLQKNPVYLVGDGQCDSPGFSAKYCTYTVMEMESELILDFETVQVSQTTSSVAMEKMAFQICLDRIIEDNYDVQILGTDRHLGINKKMREEYSQICHQYDLWHYVKSLKKKLLEASKKAHCKDLLFWTSAVVNHFYWCSRQCKGDEDIFWRTWTSLLYHVRNIHEWEDAGENFSCQHSSISDSDHVEWLLKPSAAFKALEDLVMSTKLKNDVPHLVLYCRTGAIETFHSSVLKYRSKRVHLRMNSMEARTKLAILSHNSNVGRSQAIVRRPSKKSDDLGTKRTALEHPRSRKKWIVRKLYEPVDHNYFFTIMRTIVNVAAKNITPTWKSKADLFPENIASTEKPDKKYAVSMHMSRFPKQREEDVSCKNYE